MHGLAWTDTCYCKYSFDYRKHSRLWHSRAFGEAFRTQPVCCAASPCPALAADGLHPKTAQRGASHVRGGGRKQNDECSQAQLYSMAPALCDEIAQAAQSRATESRSEGKREREREREDAAHAGEAHAG